LAEASRVGADKYATSLTNVNWFIILVVA
jgi:hypothetical protein